MTAQLIDGNALAKKIRAEVAGRTQALKARGIQPGLADHPGRRRPGQPGLRQAQGQRQHAKPACTPTLERYPATMSEADLLARIRRPERRPGDPRHPGAAAAAQAHGRAEGHRDDLAGQGRRRLPRRQRRRADGRPARLLALHAVRLHEDARVHRLRPARQARGGDRPQQHRRQADGPDAAAEERHRDHLPQRHHGPEGPSPGRPT